MKNIGKPCTGKPYARFDEGEQANLIMHRLVRHRQTKEAATDRLTLRSKGLFSTLPYKVFLHHPLIDLPYITLIESPTRTYFSVGM